MHRLMCLVLLVALTGCSSPQNYRAALRTWQGVPEPFLLKQWGRPTNVTRTANGNYLYTYTMLANRSFPANAGPDFARPSLQRNGVRVLNEPMAELDMQRIQFYCETNFEISKKGVVLNAIAYGNDCDATLGAQGRMMMNNG
jgi:hypothetical protein